MIRLWSLLFHLSRNVTNYCKLEVFGWLSLDSFNSHRFVRPVRHRLVNTSCWDKRQMLRWGGFCWLYCLSRVTLQICNWGRQIVDTICVQARVTRRWGIFWLVSALHICKQLRLFLLFRERILFPREGYVHVVGSGLHLVDQGHARLDGKHWFCHELGRDLRFRTQRWFLRTIE